MLDIVNKLPTIVYPGKIKKLSHSSREPWTHVVTIFTTATFSAYFVRYYIALNSTACRGPCGRFSGQLIILEEDLESLLFLETGTLFIISNNY